MPVKPYNTKFKLLFQQTIWLLQLHDYPSHANSKNAAVVNYLVGGSANSVRADTSLASCNNRCVLLNEHKDSHVLSFPCFKIFSEVYSGIRICTQEYTKLLYDCKRYNKGTRKNTRRKATPHREFFSSFDVPSAHC